MKTIAAIYENGVFKPEGPVSLQPGARVEISLPDERDHMEIMRERFPLSFGAMSDEDAEAMKRVIEEDDPVAIMKARYPNAFEGLSREDGAEMMKIIDQELSRIDPDAWK